MVKEYLKLRKCKVCYQIYHRFFFKINPEFKLNATQ